MTNVWEHEETKLGRPNHARHDIHSQEGMAPLASLLFHNTVQSSSGGSELQLSLEKALLFGGR